MGVRVLPGRPVRSQGLLVAGQPGCPGSMRRYWLSSPLICWTSLANLRPNPAEVSVPTTATQKAARDIVREPPGSGVSPAASGRRTNTGAVSFEGVSPTLADSADRDRLSGRLWPA